MPVHANFGKQASARLHLQSWAPYQVKLSLQYSCGKFIWAKKVDGDVRL